MTSYRQCRQCGLDVIPSVSKRAFCGPCRKVRREQQRHPAPRPCPVCGTVFAGPPWQRSCSVACGVARRQQYAVNANDLPCSTESAERIEAAYQAARAARLARERATGSRTYTTDGWAQRPGRSTIDGEMRAVEMGDA